MVRSADKPIKLAATIADMVLALALLPDREDRKGE